MLLVLLMLGCAPSSPALANDAEAPALPRADRPPDGTLAFPACERSVYAAAAAPAGPDRQALAELAINACEDVHGPYTAWAVEMKLGTR